MKSATVQYALFAVPAAIVALLVILMETVPFSLALIAREDGLLESITAISFAVATVCFALAAARAPQLREPVWARTMTICWAVLMLLALGEEISWGQRILGIETPASMSEINTQGEINFHNIGAVNEFFGGTYRWMSIYLLMMGFGIPLVALTNWGKQIFAFFRFPVSPWCYSVLFLGAYVYGAYYRVWFPVPDLQPPNTPTEIREMLMAVGSAFFALHTLMWPGDVYFRTQTSAGRQPGA